MFKKYGNDEDLEVDEIESFIEQNQFWKNYKLYRDQICNSIPENVGERMVNEKENLIFKLKTE